MPDYFLAVDIGASSGRHILGHLQEERMIIEEIHRFENGMKMKDGELCWDMDYLFQEILIGMKKCKEIGKIPVSIGIDTWGVDFVLLDEKNKVLGNTVGYRDKRTTGMEHKVYDRIPETILYQRTGIQKQIFNTIYQLMAVKEEHPEYLTKAASLLMVPDYLHFLLSGVKKTEYTNATTTQLLNPNTKNWDYDLIGKLGYPVHIFREIIKPGTKLGNLTEQIQRVVGYNCAVVVPATHDTGSAVAAVPSDRTDTLYISSGTWSLMGVEREQPDCTMKSKEHNFTNEGGYDYRFRYLKNIMGLWMIQSAKKEFRQDYSFARLCEMASEKEIQSIVDCNDTRFLAPESMITEIKNYCAETKQEVPVSDAQVAAVIYQSLAHCYASTVIEIEELTGQSYPQINIIGGGSNAKYLNLLTAEYTKRKVYAGPAEATAIGNIMIQMLSNQKLKNLADARKCVFQSFQINEYGEI